MIYQYIDTRVEKVKSPFFITIKSKKKIKIKKKSNKYKIFLNSKLVNFVRDNRTKYSLDIKCRAAKNKDKLKLIKIANEKPYSRVPEDVEK